MLTLFLLVVLTETNLPVTLSRFESLFDFLKVTLFFGSTSSTIGEFDSDELDKCKKKFVAFDEAPETVFLGLNIIGSNIEAPIAETPIDCASTSSTTDAFCIKSSLLESMDESTISIIESVAPQLSSFCDEAKLVCKFWLL
jgi:hypothetical protein